MAKFDFNKAKARVTAPVADKVKGPSVEFDGVVENGFLVIKVPLTLAADMIREGKPNEKTGIQNPFINGTARLKESIPVTVTNGDDTLTVYTRKTVTFNVFMGYAPQASNADDDGETATA